MSRKLLGYGIFDGIDREENCVAHIPGETMEQLQREVRTRNPGDAQSKAFSLYWAPGGGVLLLIAALGAATVYFCGGHFIYSLDDPYITLSLASQIWHGHYGINAVEYSSPSSSIAYPFLVAIFGWSEHQDWIPLIVNAIASAATAMILAALCERYPFGAETKRRPWLTLLLLTLMVATNLIGVVFTGLEHSLHALASVAVIYGLARTFESGSQPRWLLPTIVVLPMLRFEGLALALLSLVGLFLTGHRRAALIGAAAIGLLLIIYMDCMRLLGLPLLPSSILARAPAFQPDGSVAAYAARTLREIVKPLLLYWPATVAWALLGVLVGHPILRSRRRMHPASAYRLSLLHEWVLTSMAAGVLFAHTLLGAWDGYFRYEIYAIATIVTAILIVWHAEIRTFMDRAHPGRLIAAGLAVVLLGMPYVQATFFTALAGRGIYEQQYQMHRFVVDFYRKPVAVNDLGWVSFHNPNYVLDLWGLASEPARKARMEDPEPGWPAALTASHNVGLAMIYARWFSGVLPRSWTPVAVLRVRHAPISAADAEVTFYATSPESLSAVHGALQGFVPTLRPNVATLSLLD
jgi:hypothetical protein